MKSTVSGIFLCGEVFDTKFDFFDRYFGIQILYFNLFGNLCLLRNWSISSEMLNL